MEQYIKKSAVVAEIERRRDYYKRNPLLVNAKYCIDEDNAILKLLDTLEVEEADLEKEIDREIETRWRGEYLFTSKFRESAKHFFELGLKAKGE